MQEKEEKLKEERWQDCLRIMDDIVSGCILEFNIMQAGKLKSGSALVRRLIELLGTTDFPLNDDNFMKRAVRMLDDEQERLAIRKEQELSQAEFMRLRRLRLLGIITADEERHPDGPKKKRFKQASLSVEVDKIRDMEKNVVRDSDEVKKIIANLQGKSVEEQSQVIRDMSSVEIESLESRQFFANMKVRGREHPLLKEFDVCNTSRGLYEIAAKMIIPSTTKPTI